MIADTDPAVLARAATRIRLTGEQKAFIKDCRFQGMKSRDIAWLFQQHYGVRISPHTIRLYPPQHMPAVYQHATTQRIARALGQEAR